MSRKELLYPWQQGPIMYSEWLTDSDGAMVKDKHGFLVAVEKDTGRAEDLLNYCSRCPPETPGRDGVIDWRTRQLFVGDLHIVGYSRGRSAANFDGVLTCVDGAIRGVTVFMDDLMAMLPVMVGGHVVGKFEPCKRGQNYGLRMVRP